MLDLTSCDERALDLVRHVVTELLGKSAALRPDDIMIVGAACRDILHSTQGHDFKLRETNDLDVGIALSTWSTYEAVISTLGKAGSNGIRYQVAGIPVDLLPFGDDVERPAGTVRPAARPEGLNVYGFTEVFRAAQPIDLESGVLVRLPTIAGYGALKMAAWADRSVDGIYKDGTDLAAAVYWYRQSQAVVDHLYDTEPGNQILLAYEMDTWQAAAHQLGVDAAEELGRNLADSLRDLWSASRLDLLPRYLSDEHLPGWPSGLSRRSEIATALSNGFFGT